MMCDQIHVRFNGGRMPSRGFTLLEILIVVAVIGILAAIAIPQLNKYRLNGYNATAVADLRNALTGESVLVNDYNTFGRTENGNLPGTGLIGDGTELFGPLNGATAVNPGALLSGVHSDDARPVGFALAVSNQVTLVGHSSPAVNPLNVVAASFILLAKHLQGDTIYVQEAEVSAVYFARNQLWRNVRLAADGSPAIAIVNKTATVEITEVPPVAAGGEPPNDKWTRL